MTSYVGKPSAIGQPTRPTLVPSELAPEQQPFLEFTVAPGTDHPPTPCRSCPGARFSKNPRKNLGRS